MLVLEFPAGLLAANCYVLAPEPGGPCVIVDPGQDATSGVAELVQRHQLAPQAVLLTHGHFDHVWSAAELSDTYDVDVYVHSADRVLLHDPTHGLTPDIAAQLSALTGGQQLRPPERIVELDQRDRLDLAGMSIGVEHVPGHTPGSVQYVLPGHLCTGDLLFAGSIGRTDFPGGDHSAILDSLRRVLATHPADAAADGDGDGDTVVLPGHGPRTTLAQERAGNPFLTDIA
ncbi:MBL fold metallo-hydrolase [Lipingzhangella sp. LS1_29]|uniref:MBL fold metallo-hydrolase n=1 Tax=Lipingzhangella rawalii TaxID=2055835 RepID=A0ABU2H7Q4_9ACTN|nr:MBL fold metallo-hydrolase [Lipingzhangella rawalii]MDS1271330.1 MBL fold metallo-hydrolase [Lipingzhangella rawalii]